MEGFILQNVTPPQTTKRDWPTLKNLEVHAAGSELDQFADTF